MARMMALVVIEGLLQRQFYCFIQWLQPCGNNVSQSRFIVSNPYIADLSLERYSGVPAVSTGDKVIPVSDCN
ncbi:hypothetical protein DL89DRAFT_96527 [Linderina pennispora]|uniref:Uncharacterized protein n=1 Tax=Linderina pennispora TaxID=61395 RepID=A0A1Y1VQP3_9FUNG|nr:uncharacterized protein DL89DRAFT_96527 [Linderina pennispora]ORX63365.1 hypothetical protein DL89DRAFT_96527 [Linderina pennispora]